jgi:small subunit ribosomal protein S16
VVGNYNPLSTPATVVLDHERINHWVKVGAQMSDRVSFLVKNHPAPAVAEQPVA